MKAFFLFTALTFGVMCTPAFGQSQQSTKKPKTVKAMYFNLIETLATIKTSAESNARTISKWNGPDAVKGEDLYKRLRELTNPTISVCQAALKNPGLANTTGEAQVVMDKLNSMIAADTALTGFYNRTRRVHGGSSLGPDAVVSLIVGSATDLAKSILGIIGDKRKVLAEELDQFKLVEWPATAANTPAKSDAKSNAATSKSRGEGADKKQKPADGAPNRR